MAKSIQEFLTSLKIHGVSLASSYELSIRGRGTEFFIGEKLPFYATSFECPGFNFQFASQIFWKGQAIEIPITWDQDRDFSLTVIDDGAGLLYQAFVSLLKMQSEIYVPNANRSIWDRDDTTFIVTRLHSSGKRLFPPYILKNCKLKSVGSLNFSNTDANILQFNVSGTTALQIYQGLQ